MSRPRYIDGYLAHGEEDINSLTSPATDGESAPTNQGTLAARNWQPVFEYELGLTSGSSAAYSSPTFQSSWNSFEESFKNANSWETWDKEEISNTFLTRQNQCLPSNFGYAVDLSPDTNTSSIGFLDRLDTSGHQNFQGYSGTTAFDFVAAKSRPLDRARTSTKSHGGHSWKRPDSSLKQSNPTVHRPSYSTTKN